MQAKAIATTTTNCSLGLGNYLAIPKPRKTGLDPFLKAEL